MSRLPAMEPRVDVSRTFQEARTLALVGHPQQALGLTEQVLAAVPGHLAALVLKSEVLRQQRREGEALAVADEATARWPQSAAAHDARARCLDAMGRPEEALLAAQQARRHLDTADACEASPVFLTLVFCLRQLRRYREALAIALEGHERTGDAVLAEWATVVEQELVASERERC